jgi:hypothetical protein
MPVSDLDQSGLIPQRVKTWLGPSLGYAYTDMPTDIEFVVTNNVGIAPGYLGGLIIPQYLTIVSWVVLAAQSGSVAIDVWKIPLATYLASGPPNAGNTITGAEQLTLVSQTANSKSTLAGWTKLINQNDFVAFNINSLSGTINNLSIILQCVRINSQTIEI